MAVKTVGGIFISSPKLTGDLAKYDELTAFIQATDKENEIPRTLKILTSVCRRVVVVNFAWLEESVEATKFLATDKYHLVGNFTGKKGSFDAREVFVNASNALKDGGILGGFYVYIVNGVAGGDGQPPLDKLKILIQAAGAQILTSQTLVQNCNDHTKVIILASPGGDVKSPMLIQAKKKGSAVVILSDLLAALASQNRKLLLLGAQKEPSRKPLGASYINEETPAPAKAWTKARTKARAKTSKAWSRSLVNVPVNALVNAPVNARAPAKAQARTMANAPAKVNSSLGENPGTKASSNPVSGLSTPSKPKPEEKTQGKHDFGAVFTKFGFGGLAFDPSLGNVTGVKDVTQSPVAPKKTDPFQNPKKSEPETNEMQFLFKIKLSISPVRTTSGDEDDRKELGADGSLFFFKSTANGGMVVRKVGKIAGSLSPTRKVSKSR